MSNIILLKLPCYSENVAHFCRVLIKPQLKSIVQRVQHLVGRCVLCHDPQGHHVVSKYLDGRFVRLHGQPMRVINFLNEIKKRLIIIYHNDIQTAFVLCFEI